MLMHCVNNTLSVILTRIPGLEDMEFFADIMSPWAYVTVVILFAITLAGGIAALAPLQTPFNKEDL